MAEALFLDFARGPTSKPGHTGCTANTVLPGEVLVAHDESSAPSTLPILTPPPPKRACLHPAGGTGLSIANWHSGSAQADFCQDQTCNASESKFETPKGWPDATEFACERPRQSTRFLA